MSAPPAVSYFHGMFSNEPLGNYSFMAVAFELEATCYHEASHAVVDYLFGRSLASVGVKATYVLDNNGEVAVGYGGEVKVRGPDQLHVDFNYRRSHLMLGCALAVGPAGERRYRHERQVPMRLLGASEGDHQSIDKIAKSLARRGRCGYAFQRLVWHYAQKLVADQIVWSAVSRVADDLYGEASYELDMEEPGERWAYIEPKHVYAICRRHGLKRGMFAAHAGQSGAA